MTPGTKGEGAHNEPRRGSTGRILGLETSCDDTGVAVYDNDPVNGGLLAHKLYSQIALHADYGGVVPELASRDHVRKLLPLIKAVLTDSGLQKDQIDGVAYTAGPGLAGALLVGAAVGRSLAWAWQVPAIAVHHLEGHLLSPMLETNAPSFPFLGLLVSGGHTLLADIRGVGQYHILGESIDDAAGEAFDKIAKHLGLGYPGGPAIAQAATTGHAGRFKFPRPMTDRPGLDFSFSGLKTAVITAADKTSLNQQDIADIAAGFQEAAIDTLLIKTQRALAQTGYKSLVVAGGVSANELLRTRLGQIAKKGAVHLYFPRPEFCTDNGAMIAYAGAQRLAAGLSEGLAFGAWPRWKLDDLVKI